MDNRIRLRIMGISYNPVRSGAFALLLADEEGEKRIPILIGASEEIGRASCRERV